MLSRKHEHHSINPDESFVNSIQNESINNTYNCSHGSQNYIVMQSNRNRSRQIKKAHTRATNTHSENIYIRKRRIQT